jgi:hypothetical protein
MSSISHDCTNCEESKRLQLKAETEAKKHLAEVANERAKVQDAHVRALTRDREIRQQE